MATFVAKNSDGVKKKPMIILKEFNVFRFSFSKRRQRLTGVRGFTLNKRTTFVFQPLIAGPAFCDTDHGLEFSTLIKCVESLFVH